MHNVRSRDAAHARHVTAVFIKQPLQNRLITITAENSVNVIPPVMSSRPPPHPPPLCSISVPVEMKRSNAPFFPISSRNKNDARDREFSPFRESLFSDTSRGFFCATNNPQFAGGRGGEGCKIFPARGETEIEFDCTLFVRVLVGYGGKSMPFVSVTTCAVFRRFPFGRGESRSRMGASNWATGENNRTSGAHGQAWRLLVLFAL